MSDEGVLDPWVKEWLETHTIPVFPFPELTPELLELLRSPTGAPAHREIAKVTDDVIEGISVRFYEHDRRPAGLIVYFHGGGFCIGSIGMMDNGAREIAHSSGAGPAVRPTAPRRRRRSRRDLLCGTAAWFREPRVSGRGRRNRADR